MRRAIILWGVVLTTVEQGLGAPIVDACGGRTREGMYWTGYALHLSPWRKNRYGNRWQRAQQWGDIQRERMAGAHRLLQALRDEWAKDEVA